MRLGNPSHVLITSTPKPLPWLKTLLKDPRTVHTRVSTYANLYNLDAAYRELVIDKYEGTRKGRQELHGELLEDVEGALWDSEMIHWIEVLPEEFDYVVVAVDPAGSCNRRSDETGIIVVGWFDGEAYVLEDLSGKYSPKGWADKAWSAHEKWAADAMVAEKNYGGDMVKRNLEISIGHGLANVELVDSRRGKAIRAEPIVAQYEKAPVRVWHRKGKLDTLEDEMLSWIPGESASPNRVDALVHGLTHLFKSRMPAAVSNPNEVLKHLKKQDPGIPGRNGMPWN
jgi:phage terminase large subunit-like protein